MPVTNKVVDGFRFLPPSLSAWIGKEIPNEEFSEQIPWSPPKKPLREITFALMTSAGISMRNDPVFDVEREKREPAWGDPTYRKLPSTATGKNININHLHINTDFAKQDINVMLPLERFRELESEKIIGKLAPTAYSYYGFQLDPGELLQKTMPLVAADMHAEGVEAVFLTPA